MRVIAFAPNAKFAEVSLDHTVLARLSACAAARASVGCGTTGERVSGVSALCGPRVVDGAPGDGGN